MKRSLVGTQAIAMLSRVLEQNLREHLDLLGVHVEFSHSASELAEIMREPRTFEVAIVPADPPSGEWLQLCHELTNLKPRPSILVSFKKDTFTAWSQVLDAGGFGMVIEPYTTEGLRGALEGAVEHFYQHSTNDSRGK